MFKSILLATDGSESAQKTAQVAVELARTQGSRLTSVYVASPYPESGATAELSLWDGESYREGQRDLAKQAHAKVQSLSEGPGAPLEHKSLTLETASIAEGILAAAEHEGADLIVCGRQGKSAIERWVMGSVSAKLARSASVPVLVAG